MSPIEETGWSSKMGLNVTPPSSVFQTPPDAAATYTVLGSPGIPSTSVTRPAHVHGPDVAPLEVRERAVVFLLLREGARPLGMKRRGGHSQGGEETEAGHRGLLWAGTRGRMIAQKPGGTVC